jgi:hypothetical protein
VRAAAAVAADAEQVSSQTRLVGIRDVMRATTAARTQCSKVCAPTAMRRGDPAILFLRLSSFFGVQINFGQVPFVNQDEGISVVLVVQNE